MDVFLPQLREMGFPGVQNFLTVGLFDGLFRQNLEEMGMGYDLKVAMISKAQARDLLNAPSVFTTDEARQMAEAGADVLCHGGPIAESDAAAYVLARTSGVVGFFGASSMERLATEIAISETLQRFKVIPV
jgi:predicted TIM-barrel enzyme